jgi:hypothetical protein
MDRQTACVDFRLFIEDVYRSGSKANGRQAFAPFQLASTVSEALEGRGCWSCAPKNDRYLKPLKNERNAEDGYSSDSRTHYFLWSQKGRPRTFGLRFVRDRGPQPTASSRSR